MPHTTVKYLFEWKMLEAVVRFAAKHGGSDMTKLLIELTDGRVHVGPRQDDAIRELHDALEEADAPHLFYDPFDPPEYRWLSWSHLARAQAESLLGVSFAPGDFGDRAYPDSWGVMF